jgi:hypothetical protein
MGVTEDATVEADTATLAGKANSDGARAWSSTHTASTTWAKSTNMSRQSRTFCGKEHKKREKKHAQIPQKTKSWPLKGSSHQLVGRETATGWLMSDTGIEMRQTLSTITSESEDEPMRNREGSLLTSSKKIAVATRSRNPS